MSRTPDDYQQQEQEELEPIPRRSIFAEWGYRILFAVVALAVLVVVALPYVLDWWNPTPPPPAAPMKAQVQPPSPPSPPPAPRAEEPKPQPTIAKPEPVPVAPPLTAQAPTLAAKAPPKPEPTAGKPGKAQAPAKAPAKGEYWVQVGAFTDQANATRLAARLTAQKYPVQQLQRSSGGQPAGSTHEVFVVGASRDEVSAKLPGREYQAEAVGNEVVIRPALGLKDAVTLSKELAREGLTVKIRRSSAAGTFHVVRVGAYPDRQHAQAAKKDLEGKGVAGFIVQGDGR